MVVPMDFCKTKVAPVVEEVARPPLLPSEKNNAAAPNIRKSRAREVTSRYKSGTTPIASAPGRQRFLSPSSPRTNDIHGSPGPKRAQSAERRRPSTPLSRSSALSSPSSRPSAIPCSSPSRPSTPLSDSAVPVHSSSHRLSGKTSEGLWPSMRSLTSAFQSESISIPVSRRDKPVSASYSTADNASKCSETAPCCGKRTPLRGRNNSDQPENPKPMEKARSRVRDHHRWPGVAGGKSPSISLTRSVDATSLGVSIQGVSSRTLASDGTNIVLRKSTSDAARRTSPDDIEKGDLEIGSNLNAPSNPPPERDTTSTRPKRTLSLPSTGACRSSSPNKSTSPSVSSSRSNASPSRTRPGSPFPSTSYTGGRTGISSSVLSYINDVRKGKKNANHMEDVHQLRTLHNRYLQWRFINATAKEVTSMHKLSMEDTLYNTYISISELRDSVVSKQINMLDLRNLLKLNSILEEQMVYLDDWASLERDHSDSLAGSVKALKGSTLRLPVTVGTKSDIQAVKDAINSALDVMQSMSSSICSLLPKVEGTNSLVFELANLATEERAMLNECRELLSLTSAMQVQQLSLKTHILQLKQDLFKCGFTGPGRFYCSGTR